MNVLKPILIEVPRKTTVKELLLEEGLDPKMYLVSKNDEQIKLDTQLQEGQTIKVIPAIAGG